MPKGLYIKNLALGYDKESATSPLDFFLPLGSSLSLMGPNGGGKSTLLKTLGGFLQPMGGSFQLISAGQVVSKTSLMDKGYDDSSSNSQASFYGEKKTVFSYFSKPKLSPIMAYFPQQFSGSSNFPLKVRAVVEMGQGFSRKILQKNNKETLCIQNILDLFSLRAIEHLPVGSLSPGQLQRVLLARFYVYILHYSCPLILMDEPFSNVDESTSVHLLGIFLSLLPRGHILMLSHHNTQRALDFFSTTLLLSRTFHIFGHSSDVLQPMYWNEAHRHPPHSCC